VLITQAMGERHKGVHHAARRMGRVHGSGRPDYETFMQELLCEELKARDETLQHHARKQRCNSRQLARSTTGARSRGLASDHARNYTFHMQKG
jgi:hypothetical protein